MSDFKNQSPWGSPPGGGNGDGFRRGPTPPDIDEIVKNIQDKMSSVDNIITDSKNTIDKVRGELNNLRSNTNSLDGFTGAYQNRVNNFLNKNLSF